MDINNDSNIINNNITDPVALAMQSRLQGTKGNVSQNPPQSIVESMMERMGITENINNTEKTITEPVILEKNVISPELSEGIKSFLISMGVDIKDADPSSSEFAKNIAENTKGQMKKYLPIVTEENRKLKQQLEELKLKPSVVEPTEDGKLIKMLTEKGLTPQQIEQGSMFYQEWIKNPLGVKEYFKQQRPDLYNMLWQEAQQIAQQPPKKPKLELFNDIDIFAVKEDDETEEEHKAYLEKQIQMLRQGLEIPDSPDLTPIVQKISQLEQQNLALQKMLEEAKAIKEKQEEPKETPTQTKSVNPYDALPNESKLIIEYTLDKIEDLSLPEAEQVKIGDLIMRDAEYLKWSKVNVDVSKAKQRVKDIVKQYTMALNSQQGVTSTPSPNNSSVSGATNIPASFKEDKDIAQNLSVLSMLSARNRPKN